MGLAVKSFDELSLTELYAILKARCAVFIVEQNCPYQDLDGEDSRSLHVFYEREGFRICSDPFLEDGIPHVQMMLDLTQ